ncbi:ABC transporter permease [Paracoccus aurantiacus]|uniref:Glutathione transport system permease protein GsiC n=1 Tax=Paracoccus aurantiacus TaxID=2599412 RepID=A0A5C6RPN5_9RHOB|nr:ABC transporter permease [Paracoccus aurantiacus]TXB64087.1 ABC transporter permease [Paracoccus aurantiacus]
MLQLLLRRLAQAALTVFIVISLVFVLFSVIPGTFTSSLQADKRDVSQDVIERLEDELGLNDPLPVRFANYVTDLAQGDLGVSYATRRPVSDMLSGRIWASFKLACAAIFFAVCVGLPLGFIAAIRQGSWIDTAAMTFAVSGLSIPGFWAGLLLMYLFSLKLHLLPTFGYGSGGLSHLILPAITLGIAPMALLARTTRAAVLETLNADFIRTARSKGMSERRLVTRHLARNAFVLVLTTIGLQFGSMLGGSVVIEKLFAWPGVGSLLIDSVGLRDIPAVQGAILVIVLFFLLINTLVDLAYLVVDPRIRYN